MIRKDHNVLLQVNLHFKALFTVHFSHLSLFSWVKNILPKVITDLTIYSFGLCAFYCVSLVSLPSTQCSVNHSKLT